MSINAGNQGSDGGLTHLTQMSSAIGLTSTTEQVVERIQSRGIYTPNTAEFLEGVHNGKYLYSDFMASITAQVPEENFMATFMAMSVLDGEGVFPGSLMPLSVYLEQSRGNNPVIARMSEEVLRIIKFARGEMSEYGGKQYGIEIFTPPKGYINVNQKVFYLLYLIQQEKPSYLSDM